MIATFLTRYASVTKIYIQDIQMAYLVCEVCLLCKNITCKIKFNIYHMVHLCECNYKHNSIEILEITCIPNEINSVKIKYRKNVINFLQWDFIDT